MYFFSAHVVNISQITLFSIWQAAFQPIVSVLMDDGVLCAYSWLKVSLLHSHLAGKFRTIPSLVWSLIGCLLCSRTCKSRLIEMLVCVIFVLLRGDALIWTLMIHVWNSTCRLATNKRLFHLSHNCAWNEKVFCRKWSICSAHSSALLVRISSSSTCFSFWEPSNMQRHGQQRICRAASWQSPSKCTNPVGKHSFFSSISRTFPPLSCHLTSPYSLSRLPPPSRSLSVSMFKSFFTIYSLSPWFFFLLFCWIHSNVLHNVSTIVSWCDVNYHI